MILFLLLFLIYIAISLRFNKNTKVEKFLSRERTMATNGVFVIMVFFSHFYSYYDNISLATLDLIPLKFVSLFGQLMVTTFLFFSGYGIMYSVKNKNGYIKSFFRKRFLPTWINFAIAVSAFVVVNLILGIVYQPSSYILAYTGYESIGNSNWYMFMTFMLYIFTMLSFKIFDKNYTKGIISVIVLSLLYVLVMQYAKGGDYWCNTVLCYPLGMIIYHKKDQIEEALSSRKNQIFLFAGMMLLMIGLYLVLKKIHSDVLYLAMSIVFCLLILITSRWFYIKSRVFAFLGRHVFWIYMLQRIPMIILTGKINMDLCFVICFVITVIAAIVCDYITRRKKGNNDYVSYNNK